MPLLAPDGRRRVLTGLTVALVALGAPAHGLARVSLEYAVKANYLYKFAPFVAWPPRAFSAPASPLEICVVGEDPFDGALDDAVRGQTFDGRPVVVRRMAAIEPNNACHVLFIGRSSGQSLADTLKTVAGQPILTVTDGANSGDGPVIRFVMEDGHVRFEIDEAAARASGLVISSKLLSLALSYRRPRA